MIDGPAVLTVFLVYLAGVVIPGPNFVAVVHKAVAASRSEALALVAGIVLVNLLWATCAIAGIGVVFATFPWAALFVKVLGAAYLMWFGLRLLLNAGKTHFHSNEAASETFGSHSFKESSRTSATLNPWPSTPLFSQRQPPPTCQQARFCQCWQS